MVLGIHIVFYTIERIMQRFIFLYDRNSIRVPMYITI